MKKNPLNPVWDYADKKKEGTKIYCICTVKVGDKVCGKEIACPQHSTTALRAHLKSFHRAQYLDVEVKQQCHCYINEKATNVIIKVKNCKPITTENIRIVSYKKRLCTKVIVSNRTLAMKNDNVWIVPYYVRLCTKVTVVVSYDVRLCTNVTVVVSYDIRLCTNVIVTNRTFTIVHRHLDKYYKYFYYIIDGFTVL